MGKQKKNRVEITCDGEKFDADQTDEKSMEELAKFKQHVLDKGLERARKYHEEEAKRQRKD